MGRIAEALKRAEQERARRRNTETGGAVCCEDASESASTMTLGLSGHGSPESEVRSRVSGRRLGPTFEVPPTPKPFVISTPPILPECVDRQVVVFHNPSSKVAEKYRSARTRLLTGNPDGSSRVFAVTSSVRREGRSVTVANVGFSLAELRHMRVAVVDCDFRRGGLSAMFKASDKPGMAEVINGEKKLSEVCLPLVRSNLHLIPVGNPGDEHPSDLLTGDRIAAVFRELKDRFHYVLVDTPPMNTVADVGLIGPLCHSVLIVIRMHKTPETVLRRCVSSLQANRISIAGSILTGRCEDSPAMSDDHDYYEGLS